MSRPVVAIIALLLCSAPAFAQAPAPAGPPGTVRYYHADALGSIRAVTDANGNVVARHDYFPFGDEPANAPNPAAQRFTGQERDHESGMDYVGARYYASRTGRFTTVDPGHVGGNIFDPQSWNAYAYARNNPLRFVDPTGTDYRVNVFGGDSFWVETDRDLQGLEQGGFSFRGGNIFNAAGTWVGTYEYFDPFAARLAVNVARTAGSVADPRFIAGFYGVSALGGLGVAGAVTVGSTEAITLGVARLAPLAPLAGLLKFTNTALQHMSNPGRMVPIQTLAEAIRSGVRMPDPQGAVGAVKIVQKVIVNGTPRTLEIIYREADNTILHFLYK